jgi:S1-C subfamily serine protease
LQRLIADAPIGSTATLEISRRGERRTLDVAIERAPQAPARR